MLRQALFMCCAVFLAAAGAASAEAPSTNANNNAILIVGPDMQMSARSATGDLLTRPDWSSAAQENVTHSIEDRLHAAHRDYQFIDPNVLMQGQYGQLLRLHAIVADAAVNSERKRQHRRATARWSIGAGAADLAAAYHADYALILGGDGVYSSTSRDVLNLASNVRTAAAAATGDAAAAAALGLHALRPGDGGRRMLASLVDLHSGDIVWIRQIDDGRNDPRTPDGARRLVTTLFKNSPL